MITTVIEGRRSCGWRKPGGIYLRLDGLGWECGGLPVLVATCPTCGEGIKPARGWTWINLASLAARKTCKHEGGCGLCPLADAVIQRAGLLWIGVMFYKSPADWLSEAKAMGISRRIATIPHGFQIGATWVCLAHREASVSFETDPPTVRPGIIHIFKPARIEYVVHGDETAAELDALEKRGLSLVKIERAGNLQFSLC